MNNKFFITGTGTGIGKTIVTCSLAHQLKKIRHDVLAIKPLISGWEDNVAENDVLQILEALGLQYSKENITKISPWRFAAPLTPSMASRIESKPIIYNDVVSFCKNSASAEHLFIEGAGGIMSPITDNKTNLDLICDLDIPVILVTGTYLGAISHTLTAIKAIEATGAQLNCIIINESENGLKLADTAFELGNFTKTPIHELHKVTAHDGFIWEKTDNLLKCIF